MTKYCSSLNNESRRHFLKVAAGVTAGLAVH